MSELYEWYEDAIDAHDIMTDTKRKEKFYISRRNKKRSDRIKTTKNVKNYSKAVTLRIKGQAVTPWQKTAADIMMLTAGATLGVLITAKSRNPATITGGSAHLSLAFLDVGNAFYDWLNSD
jgi:hypothetical protein